MAPYPMPQSSSRQTAPAPSIPVSIPSGRPANDPPRDMVRGLSESIHTSTSYMQSYPQPDLTQVRINQHDSMEVNFLLNPNHPDGWGGSPIMPHMSQGNRKRLKIKHCIKAGIPAQGFNKAAKKGVSSLATNQYAQLGRIPKIKEKERKKKKPDELSSDSSSYLEDEDRPDLPPTPFAVPQDGVQPFDTLLVENFPLTLLSQTWVITPSIGASHPFDEHEQLIPLCTTPQELKDLEPLPLVELDDLESAPPSAEQDQFDPSAFLPLS